MVTCGLLVRVVAKPGLEAEVERFLRDAARLVEAEPDTTVWFALRFDPTTFGIFDAFPKEEGRQAHLAGKVAAALMGRADELFKRPPEIERVDIFALKMPGYVGPVAGAPDVIELASGQAPL